MRRLASAAVAAACCIVLVGCVDDGTAPSPPTPSVAPSPSPTEAPEPGSAEALLPEFERVLAEVDAEQDVPQGEPLVDALIDAGFDREAIERTADRDSVDEPVALLAVAVRVGERCLLGQIGQGEPSATIVPVLGTGRCLVGGTGGAP